METIEKLTIKDLSTGKLLSLRAYFFSYDNGCCGESTCDYCNSLPEPYWSNGVIKFTQDQLYKELALRPHIPNKIESKEKRVRKIKSGRRNRNQGMMRR